MDGSSSPPAQHTPPAPSPPRSLVLGLVFRLVVLGIGINYPTHATDPPTRCLLLTGMAGKGLYRVHQFSKVEMFVLATPEQSEALHQELIDIEADMFTELGLHFKVRRRGRGRGRGRGQRAFVSRRAELVI